MKKFNWKNRKVIGGLLTVIFLGFGIESGLLTPIATDVVCEQVNCDA